MERAAGWGTVGGAGAADHAGGHGLVEPPLAAVCAGGLGHMGHMGHIAAQPCSGSAFAIRHMGHMHGTCSGCVGWVLAVRHIAGTCLSCGFAVM